MSTPIRDLCDALRAHHNERDALVRKLLQAAGWIQSSKIGARWLWTRPWTFHNDRAKRDRTGIDSYVEAISVDYETAIGLTEMWLQEHPCDEE